MGITNMIATIPGFLSPTVVGVLTHNNVRDTLIALSVCTLRGVSVTTSSLYTSVAAPGFAD